MHRSRLCTLVIDCDGEADGLDAAAAFWSQALGRLIEEPSPEDGNYRKLETRSDEPVILIQRVEHPSRVHLDIETDDLDAEVKRLESLGAKRVRFVDSWWIMEAPTGHRFCVVPPRSGLLPSHSNTWADTGG